MKCREIPSTDSEYITDNHLFWKWFSASSWLNGPSFLDKNVKTYIF